MKRLRTANALFVLWSVVWPGASIGTAAAGQDAAREPAAAAIRAEPSDRAATVVFFNRPIAVLRARVLGREPEERAAATQRALDDLAAQHITGPVEQRPFESAVLISVASRGVLALTPADVDELSGETVASAASQAVTALERALGEVVEARSFAVLLRSALLVALVVGLAVLIVWAVARARRTVTEKLQSVAERTLTRSSIADADALRASRLLDIERWLMTALAVAVDVVVIYAAIGFALRRFPYTRAWGEAMRGFLLATFENLGLGTVRAIPGLFTILIIAVVTRFIARLIAVWFNAVEQGRVKPRWIYPETAQPTRRLAIALLWVFAIVVAYPYMPGSQTEAFKGVSVFLGLMVTLGSTGFVNHVMSGFMITYSRALRAGDFVRIGEVEGTVTQIGVLSTKLRTPQREEVTIPNAVVVSHTTKDYSRFNDAEGVLTATAVTIGYDAPWRQVQALLLLAAERTSGIRRDPAALVLQTSLEDFYVRYTLLVCLEEPELRMLTLHALHANIQDLFNEYGVQIMSPNYIADPAAPKIVARKDWYARPAAPDAQPRPADQYSFTGTTPART